MAGLLDQFRYRIRTADTLQRIIGLNVLVFAVIRIINAFSTVFLHPVLDLESVTNWLAIPSNLGHLLLRPWSVITYMFLHWEFMHLLTNMLMLYWFGRIFQEYLGPKKLLSTYLLGGVCGAFLFILAYNTLPYFNPSVNDALAMGASASAMAIMIAAATLLPDYTISLILIGPVKLKWVAAVVVLLDLINMSEFNAGGHIAHLGGSVYGLTYILLLRKGTDISGWLQRLLTTTNPSKGSMRVTRSAKSSDSAYINTKKAKQERLDAILDKISRSGYGSLSQDERDFLFKASKEE